MKSSLEEKLNNIRQLKSVIQTNISDESGAQKKYSEQQRLAQKAGVASVEYILKDIAIQESNHSEMFKRAIQQLEREETRITNQIETERRETERKRIEEERRKPLGKEGYFGPYKMKR